MPGLANESTFTIPGGSDEYFGGTFKYFVVVPGDANADGAVNEEDAAILADHWDLPERVVDRYVRHGKDGYERPLRDYQYLLKVYDRDWAILAEKKERSEREKVQLDKTVEVAKRQLQKLQDIQVALEAKRTEAQRQRDLAQAHLARVEKMKTEREAAIKRLETENRAIVAQLAKMWEAAARHIEQKTAIAGR